MSSSSFIGYDNTTKRRRTDGGRHAFRRHGQHRWTGPKRLSATDYSVAWICALPLEMTAARAVLDEEHLPICTSSGDENVYVLGSISGHNVIMTCLPDGVYGTTSAALVAKDICLTFPSITMPLLVGIGGGVPQSGYDIRLGDVVVSTPTSEHPAIIQYDYGKTEAAGVLVPKGTTNKPASSLLRAVASLRSKHQLEPSKISSYISQVLCSSKEAAELFACPGSELDVLYPVGCEHVHEGAFCGDCGPVRSIARPVRKNQDPMVFYGTIASGNQVVKHGRTRDRIAQDEKHAMLCFEMEAAGVIDVLPCLVIRGICDYCDAYKHKRFQNYASIAAAAYAKELLTIIPPRHLLIDDSLEDDPRLVHRNKLMEMLYFEDADGHKATVRRAHSNTCTWLTQQAEYLQWLELHNVTDHYGLFWVKGHPGTGKSVLIKYLVELAQARPQTIAISFFFNARGHHMERSTTGMYRSLIYQLFALAPYLQTFLDYMNISEDPNYFSLPVLQSLFQKLLKSYGRYSVFCFVDALDECLEEDEIRSMFEVFTQLGQLTVGGLLRLRVCFSSRHYPNISLRSCLQVILEQQTGHTTDLVNYIETEVSFGKSPHYDEVKAEVLRQSGGIFLWVVIVVRMLQREYDRGQIQIKTMLQRLAEFPPGLDALFHDMLLRDEGDITELQLCIKWVLHAGTPLKRNELYYALLSADPNNELLIWDQEEVTGADMERYILARSKGLLQLTQAEDPTVQFIHESVREFFLKPSALKGLWPGFEGFQEAFSYHLLRDCCYNYLTAVSLSSSLVSVRPYLLTKRWPNRGLLVMDAFPFLEHAVHYVFHYAEGAQRCGLSQIGFLKEFDTKRWYTAYNSIQMWDYKRCAENTKLMNTLISIRLPYLVACHLKYLTWTDDPHISRQDIAVLAKSIEDDFPLFRMFYYAVQQKKTATSIEQHMSS